ncbi:MAG TPA: hypothetical protein VI072_06860 [Polyangiaceae bacterium]
MIHSKWRLAAPLLGIVLTSQVAGAYESKIRETKGYALRTPPAPFPIGYRFGLPSGPGLDFFDRDFTPPESQIGRVRYLVRQLHKAHGAVLGRPGEPNTIPGLFVCPAELRDNFVPSLPGCRALSRDDSAGEWGWLATRKAWDHPDGEHFVLTTKAAELAGLPERLSRPFFVRYPAKNEYVVSPIPDAPSVVGGQTLTPVSFDRVEVHAVRGINLYELAQMPDFSNTVWDWASGNEHCPLDVDGAYQPEPGATNHDPGKPECHDFVRGMGALNSTHFMPAARNVYEHYHRLALQRMAACNELAQLNFAYDPYPRDRETVQTSDETEAHECEREALVYEMFAQHFMQDAWATGHMWYRWGSPELSRFPSVLGPKYGLTWDDAQPPLENLPGRRALIAGVTAATAGMIHGAKAKAHDEIMSLLPAALRPVYQPFVDAITDDPLNGPEFVDPRNIFISSTLRTSFVRRGSSTQFAGAGDLFSNLILNSVGDTYTEQRNRLLMCTATSLRQVYEAGPQAHGPATAFAAIGPFDYADFSIATECWSQLATNLSMYAAVAPVRIDYLLGNSIPDWALGMLVSKVNDLVAAQLSPAVHLPATADADRFKRNLLNRLRRDTQQMVTAYRANLEADDPIEADSAGERGVASARGISAETGEQITFMGVAPNKPLPANPPVAFMDVDDPTNEAQFPEDFYMTRLFWRSHLKELCAAEAAGAGMHRQLRDRCIAAASQPGGDPDACTACVAVVEPQIRVCHGWTPDVGPSKCMALGVPPAPDLPAEFLSTNVSERSNIEATLCGHPAYLPAFHYCTGTQGGEPSTGIGFSEGMLFGRTNLSFETTGEVACDPSFPEQMFRRRDRIAIGVNEMSRLVQGFGNLRPLVTTFEQTSERVLLGSEEEYCSDATAGRFYSTRWVTQGDPIVQSLVAPAPLWDFAGFRAVDHDFESYERLKMPFCGETQRVMYFNKACSALPAAGLSYDPARDGEPYDPDTGFEIMTTMADTGLRCSLRDARMFSGNCPTGLCSAGGICSSIGAPRVLKYH